MLSKPEIILLGLLFFACAWGVGYLVDGFMHETALGPFANGIVVGCGAYLGLYLRYRYFLPPASLDLVLTVVFAAATPIAILFALSLAKAKIF
jgi:hypothetical protein